MWDTNGIVADFWNSIAKNWVEIRVLSILLVAATVGLTSLTRTGWRARMYCGFVVVEAIFFVIYSGGDWMKAHRWFNTVRIVYASDSFAGRDRVVVLFAPQNGVSPGGHFMLHMGLQRYSSFCLEFLRFRSLLVL